jgi:amidase
MAYVQIATDFKANLASRIPAEYLLSDYPNDVSRLVQTCGLLDETELEIVRLDATDLRDATAARKYTAVAVVKTYLKAAAVVHGATNCLMDYFPDEALARAKELDEILEKTGKVVGPLHGLPISIKG